ncbi:MAG TPA: type IV secretory system conjugative DNA transfer family protein [Opitutaceae bacterium]|nr:type IV secretory system conjugative DNA transfer family protein [Opitutaceae bacterium]
MTSERAPYLGLCALALGLSAIAALFREWWIVAGALGLGLFQLRNLADPPVGLPSGPQIVKLLGMGWTLDEFLTHWVVVGRSGSGKTAGVIRTLFIQLMHSAPHFGCIAIDEKANFYKLLVRICEANGRPDKLIVLRPHRPGADRDVPTPYTMNLIGDRTISWETYAQLVIDTAVACGQETNNSFFKNQGRKTIAALFATLDAINVIPTLPDAYDFIAVDSTHRSAIHRLEQRVSGSERCRDLLDFWRSFEAKGADEKSGIKSTTELYLYPYAANELRDMFGNPYPTVHLSALDEGKILCPSIPQAFLTQRRYLIAWFKFAGYYHLLRRFDEYDDEQREKLTPIVLLADEGQNSILAAEEGLADHNTLDKIREARGTLILAMQSYSSVLPALKGRRDIAETIFANLNNHVIGAIRDETGREMAANIFGKAWQQDKSYSYGPTNRTTSVRKDLRHIFHTGFFTLLPQFKCVVFHVAGRWAQGYIPPLTDDGKRISPRYRLGFFRRLFAS